MNIDAWLSRGDAAYLTGVSPDAIGKWHARGWVDRDGQRRYLSTRRLGNGRLQYRYGDILEAERDTHLSRKGHRGMRMASV
ncbi:MAG: hypothetical protein ABWY93_18535 [Mycobacterium sp.]